MAFKAAILALALFASAAVACRISVTVDYTGEAPPAPSCEMDCTINPDIDTVTFGTTLHTFEVVPFLRDEYNQMVEVQYENGEFKSCKAVPYKTPEQLDSEFGMPSGEGEVGMEGEDKEVVEEETKTEESGPVTGEGGADKEGEEGEVVKEEETEESGPVSGEGGVDKEGEEGEAVEEEKEEETEESSPVTGEGETAEEKDTDAEAGPPGFTRIGSKYFKVTEEKTDYNGAKQACESQGSRLADIESQEENDALAAFLTTSVYIGLNDRAKENEFVNSDGSAPKFLNFNKGEPNNVRNEDCVVMKDNKGFRWNDVKCSKKFRALCQQ